jgi:hypothetical protein
LPMQAREHFKQAASAPTAAKTARCPFQLPNKPRSNKPHRRQQMPAPVAKFLSHAHPSKRHVQTGPTGIGKCRRRLHGHTRCRPAPLPCKLLTLPTCACMQRVKFMTSALGSRTSEVSWNSVQAQEVSENLALTKATQGAIQLGKADGCLGFAPPPQVP